MTLGSSYTIAALDPAVALADLPTWERWARDGDAYQDGVDGRGHVASYYRPSLT